MQSAVPPLDAVANQEKDCDSLRFVNSWGKILTRRRKSLILYKNYKINADIRG